MIYGHCHGESRFGDSIRGKKHGIRYGLVQWNANKAIDWFVDAFCRKQYGATIYRLRDDIIRAE